MSQAVRGAVAVAAALAAQWLLHAVNAEAPFVPFEAGEAFIRATPGPLATWAIETLGAQAKTTLAWSVVAAAVLGGVAFGRWPLALLVAVFAGTLLTVAGSGGPAFGAAVLAAAGSAAVAAVVMSMNVPVAGHSSPGRRAMLFAGVGVASLALVGTGVNSRRGGTSRLPAVIPTTHRLVLEADAEFGEVEGLSARITPPGEHYVVDINFEPPRVDAGSWRLRIDGEGTRSVALTFDDLLAMESRELPVLLHCISNPVGGSLISSAAWTCVPLTNVLALAGNVPSGGSVVVHGADGYSAAIPAEELAEAFVAFGMASEPVPRRHGSPARLLWPGRYGMLSVKWLKRLEVVAGVADGYWAERGWDKEGRMEIGSRIDVPGRNAQVGGALTVAGIAWARGGVSRVEVSADDERTWVEAQVERPAGEFTWARWQVELELPGGRATLAVRAQAATGDRQIETSRASHPLGATGLRRVIVEVA